MWKFHKSILQNRKEAAFIHHADCRRTGAPRKVLPGGTLHRALVCRATSREIRDERCLALRPVVPVRSDSTVGRPVRYATRLSANDRRVHCQSYSQTCVAQTNSKHVQGPGVSLGECARNPRARLERVSGVASTRSVCLKPRGHFGCLHRITRTQLERVLKSWSC